MANSTWRANSSTGLRLTTSLPNSLPYPAMRSSTNTRRGRRSADGQRLANRQSQKKMSGTSKAKGKGSSGVGKNRDEMKKANHDWANNPRWKGISRSYSLSDVRRLQGNIIIEHTLARRGAEKLWSLLQAEPFINALGALTGNQALQQVRAGLKAIYLSGWQVAADANLAGQMYPDQSLYPANSVPAVVKRINQTLQRADQIARVEGKNDIDWFVPIVADAEAGFGGPLNVFELIKAMIEAGAAGVHLEDQLASEKKCGHMGGKVLVPTRAAVAHLTSARLAADVMGVPTLVVARTDANSATLLTSDVDERDHPFLTGQRTPEGFYRVRAGLDQAIARGISYAAYADMVWCET